MIAALPWTKWIKWGGVALIGVAFVVMWMLVQSSNAQLETAELKLASALSANQVSQATIETLTFDNEYINRLLIDRKRKSIEAKKGLRDEIEGLQQQMQNIECSIPTDVTERLQQHY
ncbi:hypothetical protein [uncultured Vibrio sp.]|uniref:hypothetical protein n=1 Tax=uncultured Vibrio sp. TaxID=114054 RepID=UPI0025F7CF47|nr:hypothetical protein [uncultured Vibrio sp.]